MSSFVLRCWPVLAGLWLVAGCGAVVSDGASATVTTGTLTGSAVFSDRDQHEAIQVAVLGTDRIALTDAGGRFRMTGVPPGTWQVLVTHDGYLPRRVDGVVVSAGVETPLPTQVLQVDATVARASIHGQVLVPGVADRGGTLVFLEGTGAAVFTDVSGDFTLSGVADGARALVARRTGFADKRLLVTVPATGTLEVGTLSLESAQGPTGTLSGTVNPFGAASKAGVTVYLAGTAISARSDASGRFMLSPVLPGRYELVAALAGFRTASVRDVEVAAGQEVALPEVVLEPVGPHDSPLGRLLGRVRLTGATSSAGATVFLSGTDRSTYTDDAGSFVLDDVLPGDWTLQVMAPGFRAESRAVAVAAGSDTRVPDWDLTALSPADLPVGTLTGRVRLGGASTGNAGITVALAGTSWVGFTDDAGLFSLRDVLPGTYELLAMRSGYTRGSTAGVVVRAGQTTGATPMDLVAAPSTGGGGGGGEVRGQALLVGQTDHAGTVVRMTGGTLTTPLEQRTDASGRYAFTSVPAGVYELSMTHAPYQPVVVSNVVSQAGTFRVPDATMFLGAKVEGLLFSSVSLSPDEKRAVVSLQSASGVLTYAYDMVTRTLTPLVGQGATVSAWSADGRAAILSTATSVLSADVAAAAVTPVTPAAAGGAWFSTGETAFYVTSTGDIHRVRAGSATGVPSGTRCQGFSRWSAFPSLESFQFVCDWENSTQLLLIDELSLSVVKLRWPLAWVPEGLASVSGVTSEGLLVWVDTKSHQTRILSSGLSSNVRVWGRAGEARDPLLLKAPAGGSPALGIVSHANERYMSIPGGTQWVDRFPASQRALYLYEDHSGVSVLAAVRWDTGE
ncbi:MAG: hypothetical protein RL199_1109, partial [Pseudomonadota bacterium]